MSEKRFSWDGDILFDNLELRELGNCLEARDICDLLNELSEEKEYFERKKEYFLSKWTIVNAKNIQLRQEIKELKKENEQLKHINEQLEERLESSGIGVALKMDCEKDE